MLHIEEAADAYLPTRNLNLIIRGQAEVAAGEYKSGDFFRGLELVPAVGRLLDPYDDRPGAAAVAVLGYGFSESHFGSADAAVGQKIIVNSIPFTVVGVGQPGFDGVDPSFAAKFFIPVRGCSSGSTSGTSPAAFLTTKS